MSIYNEVAELTWQKGQLSNHGLSDGLQQEKPRDTLESVVQQGTLQQHQNSKHIMKDHHVPNSVSSIAAASSGELQAVPTLSRKRAWSNFNIDTYMVIEEECCGCASAGATFCREKNDTTMMTWTSRESGPSFKAKKAHEEDLACQYGPDIPDNEDDRDNKAHKGQTNSKRRARTAAIHNQSERKRRDRINEKMKALQSLVPNSNKTDKASVLDEVINYLKQLQAHIQMMNMASMSQMMFPLAMQQQQFQMSMLARMGMVNLNNMAANTGASTQSFPQLIQPTTVGGSVTDPIYVAPSYMMPSLIHAPPNTDPAASSGNNALIPYGNNLAQSGNMDILNMAALYTQQMIQSNNAFSSGLSE